MRYATALRASIVPGVGVYFVCPSRMARIPASLIWSGVSKSGSPAPKPTTGIPSAFICLNFELTASVADGATAERILDNSFMAKPSIQVWRHYMA